MEMLKTQTIIKDILVDLKVIRVTGASYSARRCPDSKVVGSIAASHLWFTSRYLFQLEVGDKLITTDSGLVGGFSGSFGGFLGCLGFRNK